MATKKTSPARVIALANHKGGVGKTTTTASVGVILAQMGYRVLLVDLDAQSNLTASLLRVDEPDPTVYHALTGRADRLPVLPVTLDELSAAKGRLDLVPASLQLAMVDLELAAAMSRERILARLLEPLSLSYDFVLLDCPPSLGLVTLNAFTVASDIVIPLVAEVLPFKGLTMISDFIAQVHQILNPQVRLAGVLITRYEQTNLSRQIEAGLRQQLGSRVFQTRIRKNVALAEAPLESAPIVVYAPRSNGAQDYRAFTQELLRVLQHPTD